MSTEEDVFWVLPSEQETLPGAGILVECAAHNFVTSPKVKEAMASARLAYEPVECTGAGAGRIVRLAKSIDVSAPFFGNIVDLKTSGLARIAKRELSYCVTQHSTLDSAQRHVEETSGPSRKALSSTANPDGCLAL